MNKKKNQRLSQINKFHIIQDKKKKNYLICKLNIILSKKNKKNMLSQRIAKINEKTFQIRIKNNKINNKNQSKMYKLNISPSKKKQKNFLFQI